MAALVHPQSDRFDHRGASPIGSLRSERGERDRSLVGVNHLGGKRPTTAGSCGTLTTMSSTRCPESRGEGREREEEREGEGRREREAERQRQRAREREEGEGERERCGVGVRRRESQREREGERDRERDRGWEPTQGKKWLVASS